MASGLGNIKQISAVFFSAGRFQTDSSRHWEGGPAATLLPHYV